MISEPIVKTAETSKKLSKVLKNCYDNDDNDDVDVDADADADGCRNYENDCDEVDYDDYIDDNDDYIVVNNNVVDFSEYFVNYVDEVDDDVFNFLIT
jgi:hypothetical protein